MKTTTYSTYILTQFQICYRVQLINTTRTGTTDFKGEKTSLGFRVTEICNAYAFYNFYVRSHYNTDRKIINRWFSPCCWKSLIRLASNRDMQFIYQCRESVSSNDRVFIRVPGVDCASHCALVFVYVVAWLWNN